MLIGEAWGAREELFEHAFVGSSGVELVKMLHQAGIGPGVPHDRPSELDMIKLWKGPMADHEITMANVFDARPMDNDIAHFFCSPRDGGDITLPPMGRGKFVLPQLRFHVENLWEKIRAAAPNIIVALGNTACWAVLGETKISALRGTVKMSPRLGIKVLPTYHPAAVLRQWNLRPIVVADFEKVAREAEFKDIVRIERWVTVNPTLEEIEEWITRPADLYAVDIETVRSKQISMIGFARSPKDAIVIPFIEEDRPGWNYWPTVQEEMAAWRLASKLLSSPVPKVFQNGIYDISWLLRFGFRPKACSHDTMLLHHSLYPEMLKGLGFLGSIYSDEQAWKTMRGKGNNLFKRDE